MTEHELLAVLDMSEDEQFKWLMYNDIVTNEYVKCSRHLILADLAFRLRDEVCINRFSYGISKVQKHIGITEENLEISSWECAYWGMILAKPIHWIIAALMAKGKDA